MVSLVRIEVAGEFRVAPGDLADTHEPAHGPVVADSRADLAWCQVTPAVPLNPPDRDDDERGEDIDEVVFVVAVRGVDPVPPRDGRRAARRIGAVPADLPHERDGIVVALLAPVGELAGLVEDPADGGDGEAVKDRQLKGSVDFPAEGLAE